MLGYLPESFSFCSVRTLARSTRACILFFLFFLFLIPRRWMHHTRAFTFPCHCWRLTPLPQNYTQFVTSINLYRHLCLTALISLWLSYPYFTWFAFVFFLSLGFPVCDKMFGLTKKSSRLSWIWFRFWLCLYVSPMRLSFQVGVFFTYNHSLFKPTCMGSWTRTHKKLMLVLFCSQFTWN